MIKTIKYNFKNTSAKTVYLNISEDDESFIQLQLLQYLIRIGELDNTNNEEFKMLNQQYFHKRRGELIKGQNGLNTPVSFISGLLGNLMFGTQRDLSVRQVEGIETISAVLTQVWEDLPALRFQIAII